MRRPPQQAQQRPATPPVLERGDRFPDFAAPDAENLTRIFSFEVDGRPCIMLVAQDPKDAVFSAAKDIDADIFAISPKGIPQVDLPETRRFHDKPGQMSAQALAPVQSAVFQGNAALIARAAYVLDGNQRLLAAFRSPKMDTLHSEISTVLADHLADTVPAGFLERGAPVLVLPRVFDDAMCQQLTDYLHEKGPVEGRLSTGKDDVADDSRKKTLEHTISDQQMHQKIVQLVGRRVAPEISKAFGWVGPLRFETFTIMRYSADRQDFFGLHRDTVRQDSGRRFAISLNLNDGYGGGALTFPEYGPHSYRPPKGGCAVFACALLHEALPVTDGVRYVMTAFLCDPPQQGQAPGSSR